MKRSPLYLILLVAVVDLIGMGLIIPLQADYAKRLGASGLTFGLLVGAYSLAQFIFNPLLGRWSDRVGRRRVLFLSLVGSVISHMLLGFADLANSLALMFVARLLDGMTGANIATAQAYISDVTDETDRARGMGLFGAAFGLGFVCGPALGALLAHVGKNVSGPEYGTAWPAFGAAAISLTAAILVWRMLPESLKPGATPSSGHTFSIAKLREAAANPRLFELILFCLIATFGFAQLESNFSFFASTRFGLDARGIGLLFACIGLMMVIVQGGLVGRLVKRFGEPRLLATGPFITAAGFAGIAYAGLAHTGSAWTILLVPCALVSLGSGMTGPSLMSLVSRQAPPGRQGETLGILQGVASLARTLSPPVAGLLFDRGKHLPYVLGAAVFVCMGGFAASFRARQRASLDADQACT